MRKGQKIYRKVKTHWTQPAIILRVYKNKIQIMDCNGYIGFEKISDWCAEGIFFKYYHIK